MADANTIPYPAQYETEVLLKDGSRLLLRPIKKDDVERWLDFISRLSHRTKYLRFHSVPKLAREDAIRFCSVDYDNAFAFVAEMLRGAAPGDHRHWPLLSNTQQAVGRGGLRHRGCVSGKGYRHQAHGVARQRRLAIMVLPHLRPPCSPKTPR